MSSFPYFFFFFFFFNDTATTEIYTLSLHDALPICRRPRRPGSSRPCRRLPLCNATIGPAIRSDRKSTRLNSSHRCISYAVFCLKKKKKKKTKHRQKHKKIYITIMKAAKDNQHKA